MKTSRGLSLTIIIIVSLYLTATGGTITLGPDGRYRGVTVRISDDIPDTNCPRILSNLKVIIRKYFYCSMKYFYFNIILN